MNRKYIWLSVCVTVLLLSLLIPWLMLFGMERRMLDQKDYIAISGELVDYGALSVARKQLLLGGGGLIITSDHLTAVQEQECLQSFRKEMHTLVDSGALPGFVTDLAREAFTVKKYLALYTDSSEAFRYYELTNDSGLRCVLDLEQQTVLSLEICGLSDFYFDFLYESGTDSIDISLSQQLRAWANYYGHMTQDIVVRTDKVESVWKNRIVYGDFLDDETAYCFGLTVDTDTHSLYWSAIEPLSLQEESTS